MTSSESCNTRLSDMKQDLVDLKMTLTRLCHV